MDTILRSTVRAACSCAAAALLIGCSNSSSSPMGAVGQQGAYAMRSTRSGSSVPDVRSLTHYYLVTLDSLGGTASVANSINNRGWISGLSTLSGNAAVHATLWVTGQKVDLRTLGGPDSGVGWPVKNDLGEIAGISTLGQTDPLAENFCGFGSANLCAGFTWKNNVLTPLTTLGGDNSFGAGVNDAGEIVGFAEIATHDPSCGAPQVFDYNAAIWRPNGHVRALKPTEGDAVSQAVSINSAGDAVGASGPCGPPNNVGYGTAHAVLWHSDGSPTDLGTLGGTTANIATAINDAGDIVGQSALTGNTTYHAVLWRHGAIRDLGTLPGDFLSEALGVNDKQQVVGYSCDSSGNCRGFIWQNGSMSDLNLLVPRSQFDVTYAGDINDQGSIVGQAVNMKTGKAPAIVLIPGYSAAASGALSGSKVMLPEVVRRQLLANRGFRLFIK